MRSSDHWNVWADVNVTRFNASNPGETFDPSLDNDQRIDPGNDFFRFGK